MFVVDIFNGSGLNNSIFRLQDACSYVGGGGLICDIKILHQDSALKMWRGLGVRVGGERICGTLRYFCYRLYLSLLYWHVGSRVALCLYMQSDYGELNSNLLVILWYLY